MNDRVRQLVQFAGTRHGAVLATGTALTGLGIVRPGRLVSLAGAAGSALIFAGLSSHFSQQAAQAKRTGESIEAVGEIADALRARADAETDRLGRTNIAVDTARNEIRKARSEVEQLTTRILQLEADLRPLAARRAWTSAPARSSGAKPELFLTEGMSSLASDGG